MLWWIQNEENVFNYGLQNIGSIIIVRWSVSRRWSVPLVSVAGQSCPAGQNRWSAWTVHHKSFTISFFQYYQYYGEGQDNLIDSVHSVMKRLCLFSFNSFVSCAINIR